MELLIILVTLIVGFAMFITVIYFMAKLFFPRMEDVNDTYYTPVPRKRLSKGNRNPYSFPRGDS